MKLIGLSILAGAAFLLSLIGGELVHRHSTRWAILDIPNQRSSHTAPTPRGGGLGVVVVVTIGLIVYALWQAEWFGWILGSYLVGAVLISGVSWIDDMKSVHNYSRFGVHSLGAVLAVFGVGYWGTVSVPLLGQLHVGWLGMPLTFLWVVGLTNAYNFMDGIDGIAGGQAVVAGVGWATLGWLSGQPLVEVLGLLLAAGTLGFLGHNWPPARIFMGDVGSAFLGYTFAVMAIMAAEHDSRMALAGALLVWPFVFDASFTFLRRLGRGENVFAAHRSHLYQRLVINGYSHRFVSLLYIGLALVGVGLALAWCLRVTGSTLAVALVAPLLCLSLWVFVVRQERRQSAKPQSRVSVVAGPP